VRVSAESLIGLERAGELGQEQVDGHDGDRDEGQRGGKGQVSTVNALS